MALLFQADFEPPGEWGLWHITESEADLRGGIELFAAEREQLDCIRGEGRRREFLAARHLLHRMSGRTERGELFKDTNGKPHLRDSPFHVSISHTVNYSAAIAHPRPCGIDVQRIVPRIRRLARKFVGPAEARLLAGLSDDLLHLHLIWSAKEALYKAYGRRQLDFKEHLFTDFPVDLSAGAGAGGELRTGEGVRTFDLRYRLYSDFVLVGAVESSGS